MTKRQSNLYELRPKRKGPFEELKDGTVEVLLPRYGNSPIGRVLKKVLNERPVRVHLDDIGTSVWRLCNGDHTVLEIGQTLHSRYGNSIEPVFDRLETFLKQMHRAGLIELEN